MMKAGSQPKCKSLSQLSVSDRRFSVLKEQHDKFIAEQRAARASIAAFCESNKGLAVYMACDHGSDQRLALPHTVPKVPLRFPLFSACLT
jgi:hypothetical protein